MTLSFLQLFPLIFGIFTSIVGGLFMLMPGHTSTSRIIMITFTLQGLMLTMLASFPEAITLGFTPL